MLLLWKVLTKFFCDSALIVKKNKEVKKYQENVLNLLPIYSYIFLYIILI